MVKVFISYSRKDRDFADQLVARLEREGYDVWIDRFNGTPSGSWWDDICRNIDQAEHVIFIMSPPSLASAVCQLELAHALRQGKHLIPIAHEPVEPKSFMGEFAVYEPDAVVREMLAGRDLLEVARSNWKPLRQINRVQFYDPDNSIERLPFDSACERLLEALRRDEEHIQIHTRLGNQAHLWENKGRKADLLLYGEEISDAEAWLTGADGNQPAPTDLHRAYIAASRENQGKRQRELKQAQLAAIGLMALAMVGFVAFGVAGFRAYTDSNRAATAISAQQQAQVALETIGAKAEDAGTQVVQASTQLADVQPTLTSIAFEVQAGEARIESLRLASSASEILNDEFGNSQTAALLAVRALRANYTAQADTALIRSIDRFVTPQQIDAQIWNVNSAVFSPNGQFILTAGDDAVARIYDTTTAILVRSLEGHSEKLWSAVYSRDGRFILTASGDALSNNKDTTARMWDAERGTLMRVFAGHTEAVLHAEFSPDGRFVLTTSGDGTARIWEVTTGQVLQTFYHPDGVEVSSAVYSPDQRFVLTADSDSKARLWEANSGLLFQILDTNSIESQISLTSAAFSPNGQHILLVSRAGTVYIWDSSREAIIRTFTVMTDKTYERKINSAEFSPDGTHILTASADGFIRIWEIESGLLIRAIAAYSENVYSASYSPDGNLIVTSNGSKYGSGFARVFFANYNDLINFACSNITSDLDEYSRKLYGIAPDAPATCPQFATEQNPAPVLAPTWTPISTQPIPVWTPIASPTP